MVRVRMLGQLLLLAMLARGADAAEPATGWYIGASGGAAKHDVSKGGAQDSIVVGFDFGGFGGGILNVPRTTLETDEDSTGWRGLAGYRFSRYLAAELEYLDFGTSNIHETFVVDPGGILFPSPLTIENDFATDVSGPAVSALGLLPLGERFDLFLRVGVLFADAKVKTGHGELSISTLPDTTTYADRVWIGGVGVDWNFAGRWSARLEYERSKEIEPNRDIAASHVELLSLGVLFKL
jgi:opacity protein-like surface antigen